jgi:hypothetical protein
MRMHAIVSVFALLLVLDTTPMLAAEEGLEAHSKHNIQTITLDGNDVRPSQASLSHGDVLAFANYSAHPVRVIFTEPADLKDKIRCSLVRGTEKHAPEAPWALFSWENEKLSATVPPGQFASVCSLEPGSYTFTATSIETAAQGGPGTKLPGKGQIVVK